MSKKIRVIGYDLNPAFCQISYSAAPGEEAETLYLLEGKEGTQLPLLIAKKEDEDEWVTGLEARRVDTMQNGVVVRDLLAKSLAREQITAGEETVSAASLLALFFRQSMQRVYLPASEDYETYLVITVPEISEEAITLLKDIAAGAGFVPSHIFVQDYRESAYDYMASQPKELWNYEAAFFCFEKDALAAYRLRKMPLYKGRRAKIFTMHKETYPGISPSPENDMAFLSCVRSFFGKSLISSVYLIGTEFEGSWYQGTLRLLCNGRRVFQGNNLFSRGACGAGFRKSGAFVPEAIYLDDYKIDARISLQLKVGGKEQWYPLARQGENWYEIHRHIEILVDAATELKIRIDRLSENMPVLKSVLLGGIFDTQRRTLRLRVEILFFSRTHCQLQVKDVDFGEIRKSTGYEQTYSLTLTENER